MPQEYSAHGLGWLFHHPNSYVALAPTTSPLQLYLETGPLEVI